MLARFIVESRPDWQLPGVLAALARIEEPAFTAAQIAVTCAADPDARTPGAMSNPLYRPAWSVTAEDERATAKAVQAERERSQRILAELRRDAELAAPPDRVREIFAGTPWERKP